MNDSDYKRYFHPTALVSRFSAILPRPFLGTFKRNTPEKAASTLANLEARLAEAGQILEVAGVVGLSGEVRNGAN
ncbi:MAG: hypothetical protein HS110_07360 [Zoogloeaceae bacterium]|nr:hypothetical protein [Zoogloeaceae bacterium]